MTPLLRALAALDRPPRLGPPLAAVAVTAAAAAALEAYRMPAWATPDAVGARLLHRCGGSLLLLALGLGALVATAAVARVRRDGLLDHLHLGGATGTSLALALAARSAAVAMGYTALASPLLGLALLAGTPPPAVVASALSAALACAALGAGVGVAVAATGPDRTAPWRVALAVAVVALAGHLALGHEAGVVALAPLRAAPHGALWWTELLADGRASTAMRRVGVVAPWWLTLSLAPALVATAARRLGRDGDRPRRPWLATLVATALITAPLAVFVHATSRPVDRLAWLHAALAGWTALALVLVDGELSLAIALLGTALLGAAGAAGLSAVRGFADVAIVSAAIAGNLLLLSSLAASLARRARRATAFTAAVALCAAPAIARELSGAEALAGLSPLAAFGLLARELHGPAGAPWREAARAGMTTAHCLAAGLGAATVIVGAALKYRRSREVVR